MSVICDAHKKKVVVELLYNSVHRKFNQLEVRCGRENQHPAEWAPGPRLSNPGEWERNAVMANRVEVNMLQSVPFPTPYRTQLFQIKWEVYFSWELCRSSLLCRR